MSNSLDAVFPANAGIQRWNRRRRAVRWKWASVRPPEQLHREVKQPTGLEACQCRQQRAQRTHVGCALLVWVRLKSLTQAAGMTVYALKQDLLSDYMVAQLRNPAIRMALA